MTQQAVNEALALYAKALRRSGYPALLGDGQNTLAVTGRESFVYARVQLPEGKSLLQVRCRDHQPVYNAPVIVDKGRDDVWQVVGEDPFLATEFWGNTGSGNVGPHAATHGLFGGDPLLLDTRQLSGPCRVTPSSPADMNVHISPYVYRNGSAWQCYAGGSFSLTGKAPTSGNFQVVICIGIQASSNTIISVDGTARFVYSSNLAAVPFDAADVAEVLIAAEEDFILIAAVRLYYGQSAVRYYDIFYDGRQLAGFIQGAGATGDWDVNSAPANPSAYDDEFNDASVAGLWTEFDSGAIQTVSEAGTDLSLSQASQADGTLTGERQTLPAGDFTIVCRVKLDANSVSGTGKAFQAGLVLWEDASGDDDKALILGPGANGVGSFNYSGFGVEFLTGHNDLAGYPTLFSSFTASTFYYLRLRRSGTAYYGDFGTDGKTWTTIGIVPGFTPTHFGIGMYNENTGASKQADFDFFRYRDSYDQVTDPVYGRTAGYVLTSGDTMTGKLNASAGLNTKFSTADVSNPPTDAELDSAFGQPADVGSSFLGILDDNGSHANLWIIASDGANWWHVAMTKAT